MEDLLCKEENVPLSPATVAAAAQVVAVPQVDAEDPVQVIRLMARREVEYGACNDKYLAEVQRDGMEESWRRKICRWMFETAKAFDLTRDTVGCAVYIMDYYLSTKSVSKILLQLVSMVSMYIASKMHEHQPISMEEMELLSQRKFTRDDIRRVEAHLLKTLGWRLNPPSSFMFARDFIHVLSHSVSSQCKADLERDVMVFLQDVVEDYGSLRFRSSSLGIAAVHVLWNARRMRPSSAIQDAIRAADVAADDFVDCYRWLRELHHVVHQPLPQPRFVSVEESKTTDASRSISPTGVDDAAVALGDHADAELPAELLAKDDAPEPQRKRARLDAH